MYFRTARQRRYNRSTAWWRLSNIGLDSDTFVFIIPVRRPDDTKVADYSIVEHLLATTVASLLRQTHGNIRVVVVCHRIPLTIGDPRVTFVDVSHHQLLGRNPPVRLDKGIKLALGVRFAVERLGAREVMPMDADDFAHVDLAEVASSLLAGRSSDVVLLTRGVHVQLADVRGRQYSAATIVDRFDTTCGSCRIFHARRLWHRLAPLMKPNSGFLPTDTGVWVAPTATLASLVTCVKEPGPAHDLLYCLGDHLWQEDQFSLHPIGLIAAAKSLGHPNHDGPRPGEIHQEKSLGTLSIWAFRKMFGLALELPQSIEALFETWLPRKLQELDGPRLALRAYTFVFEGRSWTVVPSARSVVPGASDDACTVTINNGASLLDLMTLPLVTRKWLRPGMIDLKGTSEDWDAVASLLN